MIMTMLSRSYITYIFLFIIQHPNTFGEHKLLNIFRWFSWVCAQLFSSTLFVLHGIYSVVCPPSAQKHNFFPWLLWDSIFSSNLNVICINLTNLTGLQNSSRFFSGAKCSLNTHVRKQCSSQMFQKALKSPSFIFANGNTHQDPYNRPVLFLQAYQLTNKELHSSFL